MNYDLLEQAYRDRQHDRIGAAVGRLRDRGSAEGRTVPDEEDLLIGAGRRLPAAILFLDISGFSSIPSETESEQARVLSTLSVFVTEMVRIAEDYGGTIEKNTGDGLMAYFEDGGGDPPEEGCKRAIACALTMVDTMERVLARVFEILLERVVTFRIGVDYGNVTIARIGAPRRFNSLVAIGTTANVACKMLRFAEPGEIVVGERVVYRLPPSWRGWTLKMNVNSGWVWRATEQPYLIYKYVGRWDWSNVTR